MAAATPQKKSKWRKDMLIAAFTVAAGAGTLYALQAPTPFGPDHQKTPASLTLDNGITLPKESTNILLLTGYTEFFYEQRSEHRLQKIPQERQIENKFMAQFDQLRDKSILDKATGVNLAVNSYVNDDMSWHEYYSLYHWSAAVKTIESHLGDCKQYTALKYASLRHLGVPASRMYVVTANADGPENGIANTGKNARFLYTPNHVVLAVNIAADGKKPDYVLLSNGIDKPFKADEQGWTYFDAMNENGAWGYSAHLNLIKMIKALAILAGVYAVAKPLELKYRKRKAEKKRAANPAAKNKKQANGPS